MHAPGLHVKAWSKSLSEKSSDEINPKGSDAGVLDGQLGGPIFQPPTMFVRLEDLEPPDGMCLCKRPTAGHTAGVVRSTPTPIWTRVLSAEDRCGSARVCDIRPVCQRWSGPIPVWTTASVHELGTTEALRPLNCEARRTVVEVFSKRDTARPRRRRRGAAAATKGLRATESSSSLSSLVDLARHGDREDEAERVRPQSPPRSGQTHIDRDLPEPTVVGALRKMQEGLREGLMQLVEPIVWCDCSSPSRALGTFALPTCPPSRKGGTASPTRTSLRWEPGSERNLS